MGRSLKMDAFLGHKTRSAGGSNFLRWRKNSPPVVDTVLHRKATVTPVWQHNIPRIVEQTDNSGNVHRRVWGQKWNCLEDEEVLTHQFFRDRDTGERKIPPVVCPMCRLQEALRKLLADETLSMTEKLFRWEGDDPKETTTLTLGGMLNMYGSNKLTEDQKKEMKSAGIQPSQAWKQNCNSKCAYLFVIVDANNPAAGVHISFETTALGDAVKTCIHNKIVAEGEEDGNPMESPYAIRWSHHPDAPDFGDKYKAIAMSQKRVVITPEILALIDSEPPDTSNLIKPGNTKQLMAELQVQCVLADPTLIPWDDIWGPSEGSELDDTDDEPPATQPAPKVTKSQPNRKKSVSKAGVKKEPAKEPAGEIVCDECGEMMAVDATTCPACGADYEVTEDEPEPEPPPKKARKSRKLGF